MLITHTQVDELLDTLVNLSGLDDDLFEQCGFLVRAERYDEAVGRAFVVLEERLRELLGVRGGSGVNLAQKAFSTKTGDFAERLRRPAAEIEGLRDLFVGAFRAYRNRAAHTVAGYGLDEARAIIHLVNLLLLVLNQVDQAPTERIPQKTAEILGPVATERLQRFLERVKSLGVISDLTKGAIAYRVTLKCQAPDWPKPRPYLVTIMYLSRHASRPEIQFHSAGFEYVSGLDVEQLEADLLQLGCVRVAAKTTPIRLYLTQYNDQATFDRIFEILKEIVDKHQV